MIFHPDHLGSISYLTDPSGNVVTRMSYTPYGEKVKSACTGPDIFNHKYTGQVDDTSTGLSAGTSGNAVEDENDAGLLYYNARYYDPYIGRFISADSIVPGAGNTQAFNRYMYVAGNPVNHRDPTGHYCLPLVGAIIGAVIGGICGAGNALMNGYKPTDAKFWKSVGKGVVVGAAIGATIGYGMAAYTAATVPGAASTAGAAATASTPAVATAAPAVVSTGSPFSGAIASGLFNAYFSMRSGGSVKDICVAFSIGFVVGYIMPGNGFLNGAIKSGLSNLDTQIYNMTIADNKQKSFDIVGLGMSMVVGALITYGSEKLKLFNFKFEDNLKMLEGSLKTTGYGVKVMAGYGFFLEESWYYNGSPENEENRKSAKRGMDNVQDFFADL